jgi:hypothetical protein
LAAGSKIAERTDQRVELRGFLEKVGRARLQRVLPVVGVIAHDDGGDLCFRGSQRFEHTESIDARHLKIEHNDMGRANRDQRERGDAVGRLLDRVDAGDIRDQGRKALPHLLRVVHNQYSHDVFPRRLLALPRFRARRALDTSCRREWACAYG